MPAGHVGDHQRLRTNIILAHMMKDIYPFKPSGLFYLVFEQYHFLNRGVWLVFIITTFL